ncbi:MAG: helix-turn-helix transcriptional regulator [Ruminococcaceae bacterium]|nr:helix-turn-helix transcriptional regulator [Oscillospiraceae bacterium]
MFWEKFVELCNKKGLSPNNVCAQLGYSSAIATKWKNGSTPRSTTLHKIADFFGVSVEYLLGKEVDTSEDAELNNYLQELRTRPEMRMLFNLAKGATKSDVEKAVKIIETIIQD